ncbi:MAG: type II toxin-antitoxin system RelE/ParE family toxin [Gulosibacter sp.]|uniref:type II toxin-antitoxin system RelE/ParE family toxin n=1 Tax=Gulosibacter sp. TaxID=2817531 RepID=UPI003F90C0AA
MTRTVTYSPRALQQLTELYLWVAEQSGFPDRADGYVSAIVDYCEDLGDFPLRGADRSDLRPGLRTIGFRRRVVIAFAEHEQTIQILGIFYGGQDYEDLISSAGD